MSVECVWVEAPNLFEVLEIIRASQVLFFPEMSLVFHFFQLGFSVFSRGHLFGIIFSFWVSLCFPGDHCRLHFFLSFIIFCRVSFFPICLLLGFIFSHRVSLCFPGV